MISTFLSYRMFTADIAKSVQRTLANAQVAREQSYYRENIGKVTSVDDFLNNQRLYAYAMKAYGLEDMTYAKAFMRKVLESDLSDENSFVRKLVDSRYLEFARAFNFTPEGGVSAGTTVVQDQSDLDEVLGLYSEQRLRKGMAVATEVQYYQARMATITSADQFVADERLFNFALTAYGIDASIASEAAIKSVISGDLSVVTGSPHYAKYEKLAAAFSFQADGTVASGGEAQTASQMLQTIYLNYDVNGASASASAAAFNTGIYKGLVPSLTSVDELVDNDLLRDYAVIAAGIDPVVISKQMVRDILTSDLNDPASYANTKPEYAKLAAMFNFNTDGSLDAGVPAQTTAQLNGLVDDYHANYQAKALDSETLHTSDYKRSIGLIFTVDDLLNDQRAYTYVMRAFGLDPNEESKSKIRQVLTSDPNDPFGFVRRLRDERYVTLASAFNFGSDGLPQGPLRAQFSSVKTETIDRYTATLGTYDYQKEAGEVESDYYSEAIDNIETVDQLLADKRLVAYIKKAFGFEKETISDGMWRQILTSDVDDPKSFVNLASNSRFRELAGAFNFATDGTAKRIAVGQVQDPNVLANTQDLYIRQTMEQTAGDQNAGVRLALYFQRKASSIQSAYSILADKALLEVVMTSLGLPDTAAQADVDVLAKMISSRINLEDFKDPAKVEKFLARFAALYDIQNPQSTTSIPSLLLGQEGLGIGQDLLSSIQSVKVRI
ncbi:DUF1217 domain-containing protein [Hyphomicrobium sp.]|uniref:DUF1217 domain-containing protein n=1 Tax=Hyphomicrobium sp. TaxID=82 RepID=UPI0025BE89DF|nr:DUF1217 domain-containing protein [Hyphomicrobium sp.]MCC7251235.1 DUF1217 domain-containing protein [Hyphomicrobium sp.]